MSQVSPSQPLPGMGLPYQDITAYDAPGVALGQVLNHQATWSSVKNAFLSPDKLSPAERVSLADMLGQSTGFADHPITDTLIHLVTNPFVWLFFMTAAPGLSALKGGRSLFGTTGKAFSAWTAERGGLLQWTRLLTANQAGAGTHLPEAASDLANAIEKLRDTRIAAQSKLDSLIMDHLGVDTLEPNELPPSHPQAHQLKRVQAAMAARLGGFDRENYEVLTSTAADNYHWYDPSTKTLTKIAGSDEQVKASIAGWHKQQEAIRSQIEQVNRDIQYAKAEGRSVSPLVAMRSTLYAQLSEKELHNLPLISQESYLRFNGRGLMPKIAVDQILNEVPGLKDAVDGYRRLSLNALDGITRTGGKVDRNKLWKLISSFGHEEFDTTIDSILGESGGGAQGRAIFDKLRSKEVLDAVRAGSISHDTYADMLERAFLGSVDRTSYFPLNTIEQIAVDTDSRLTPRNIPGVREPELPTATNRAVSRTGREPIYSPSSLSLFEDVFGSSPALEVEKQRAMGVAEKLAKSGQQAYGYVIHDTTKSFNRYFKEMEETRALHVDAPHPEVLEGMRESLKNSFLKSDRTWSPSLRTGKSLRWDQVFDEDKTALPGFATKWEQAFSRGDALVHGLTFVRDPNIVKQFREAVLPTVLGRNSQTNLLLSGAFRSSKSAMMAFANSKLGQQIASMGEGGSKFVDALKNLGNPNVDPSGRGVSGALARFFYSTHLGVNLGSVLLNATQPFILAVPHLGFKAVLKGYGRALGEMFEYAKYRTSKFGWGPIARAQRQEAIEHSFKYANRIGLGHDYLHTLDSTVFHGRRYKRGGVFDQIEEFLLKGFEKSEWMNRTSVAHSVEAAYEDSGRPLDQLFHRDLERFVQETQFGGGPTNTPWLFQKGPLSDPALKQFLTFPVRSFTAVFNTFPNLHEKGYARGLGVMLARGLGASAVLYEVGKHALNVDTSRGLFVSATTDLFGGDRFLRKGNDWLAIPPIIDVPKDMLSGLASGDMQLVRDSVARSLPGGVAAFRALSVAPDLSHSALGLLGSMQKTYAGWSTPLPDGRIPLFNNEGRLVDFRSPTQLIYHGLGVDMGNFTDVGKLDNYLVKQRTEILQYRQRYLAALAANNFPLADRISKEFSNRFRDPNSKSPLPLTVTKAQVEAFLRNRETPRTERILDRVPPEGRSQYAGIVASSPQASLNTSPQDLLTSQSASHRARQHFLPPDLARRIQEEVMRRVSSVGTAATQGTGPFGLPGAF